MSPKFTLRHCASVYFVAFVFLLNGGVLCQQGLLGPWGLFVSLPQKRSTPKYTSTEPTADSPTGFISKNLTEIQRKFPGYFRTPEEQARLEKHNEGDLVPTKVLNVSSVYKRCFTNDYCELMKSVGTTMSPINKNNVSAPTSGKRKRRQVDVSLSCELDKLAEQQLTFHGCCVSYSDIITPDYLETAEPGQSGQVMIAQFGLLSQYFEIQQCCQAKNCTGCQCAQTYYIVSAVVAKNAANGGTLYVAEYVRVPGCCKCLNTFLEAEFDQLQ